MTQMQFLKKKMDEERGRNIAILEQSYKEGSTFEEDFEKFFEHKIEWSVMVKKKSQSTDEFIKRRNEIINAYADLKKKLEDSYYDLRVANVEQYADMIDLRVKSVISEHFVIEVSDLAQELPKDTDELDIVELLDELEEEFDIDLPELGTNVGVTVSNLVDMVKGNIR